MATRTFAEVVAVAQSKGGRCLSAPSDFFGTTSVLRFACAAGHEWTTRATNLLHRDRWCPECGAAHSPALTLAEHQALFLDRADRDVYPRLVPGKDGKTLQRLLDDFYIWVSMYEMTRQWLVEDGPFDYDYGWLTSKFNNAEIKDWVDSAFKVGTGVHPDAFSILR